MATISYMANLRGKLSIAFKEKADRAAAAGAEVAIEAHEELVSSWKRKPVFSYDTSQSGGVRGSNNWAKIFLEIEVSDINFGGPKSRWMNLNDGVVTAPNGINMMGKGYPMRFKEGYSPKLGVYFDRGSGDQTGNDGATMKVGAGRKIEARDMIGYVYKNYLGIMRAAMKSAWGA